LYGKQFGKLVDIKSLPKDFWQYLPKPQTRWKKHLQGIPVGQAFVFEGNRRRVQATYSAIHRLHDKFPNMVVRRKKLKEDAGLICIINYDKTEEK